MSTLPEIITSERTDTRLAPRYSVILWDSPDHTFDYVIEMMRKLFGMPLADAMSVAAIVHTEGRANCGVFGLEEAEQKRDKIHAYGKDHRIKTCAGSMQATIEKVD
jgi:ATP-dependent Clp protease adaptor protein ClpS